VGISSRGQTMAREPNSTERNASNSRRALDFEHEVSAVLNSLGFKLTHRLSVDKAPAVSLHARRVELGREMDYGLELKLIVDAKAATEAIERFSRSTEEEGVEFDAYWLIGYQVSTAARTLFDHSSLRHYVYSLPELKQELSRRRTRSRTKKWRTKVGKAVGANHTNLLVTIAALGLLISERIAVEEAERPNSDDAIARRDAMIAGLRTLREELAELERDVRAFVAGRTKESAAVKSVNSFADGVQAWWKKGHEQILHSSFGTAVFTMSISICSLAGVSMHGKTVAMIAGALAGGKPLIDSLKGLGKNLFK
jgi:hypothetical protein